MHLTHDTWDSTHARPLPGTGSSSAQLVKAINRGPFARRKKCNVSHILAIVAMRTLKFKFNWLTSHQVFPGGQTKLLPSKKVGHISDDRQFIPARHSPKRKLDRFDCKVTIPERDAFGSSDLHTKRKQATQKPMLTVPSAYVNVDVGTNTRDMISETQRFKPA